MNSHGENGNMEIGAKITIKNKQEYFELMPTLVMTGSKSLSTVVEIPVAKNGYVGTPTVALNGINATDKIDSIGIQRVNPCR